MKAAGISEIGIELRNYKLQVMILDVASVMRMKKSEKYGKYYESSGCCCSFRERIIIHCNKGPVISHRFHTALTNPKHSSFFLERPGLEMWTSHDMTCQKTKISFRSVTEMTEFTNIAFRLRNYVFLSTTSSVSLEAYLKFCQLFFFF
jgi:hypothetical protein